MCRANATNCITDPVTHEQNVKLGERIVQELTLSQTLELGVRLMSDLTLSLRNINELLSLQSKRWW